MAMAPAAEDIKEPGKFVVPIAERAIKKKKVTYRLLKHGDGETKWIKFLVPFFEGKEIPRSTIKAKALMAVVWDWETNTERQYIISAVVRNELCGDPTVEGDRGSYPDHSYVGKTFKIYKEREEGKNYSVFDIEEYEVPGDDGQ
jgi:hypothetical protein